MGHRITLLLGTGLLLMGACAAHQTRPRRADKELQSKSAGTMTVVRAKRIDKVEGPGTKWPERTTVALPIACSPLSVRFEARSYQLDRETRSQLNQVKTCLDDGMKVSIEILPSFGSGVAKPVGGDAQLAKERADMVEQYLRDQGVDESRYEVLGKR